MSAYKDALTFQMDALARDPATVFVGYGLTRGRAMGTLKNVSAGQILETPTAENLMVGVATGMALAGRKPVVFFERMDFVLNALDAIVNHLDKLELLSRGQFNPKVLLRVVVGNREKPLFTGPTHCQDFSEALKGMLDMPIYRLRDEEDVHKRWELAALAHRSCMLIEYKDLIQ